jgi:type IV pilus assembly protein PilC
MARLFYIARNAEGKKITGFEEASGQEEAVNRLQARNLVVISIVAEYKEGITSLRPKILAKARLRFRRGRITSEDLTLFCRQLATLLGAGVAILKSIDIISMQVSSRRFYSTLKNLQKDMEAGLSLHESMAKHQKIFSDLWVNLVESGEASGNLAVVLSRLAGYLERNAAFKRKVISALIYPGILFFVSLGALLFLTIKIIPTFAELFQGFNITLPILTQTLIKVSLFIRKFLFVFFVSAVFGFYLLKRYVRTSKGRRKYEALKFKMPLFGEFFRAIVVERFSSEMSTLVESGVPILYSLDIAEHSVDNLIIGDTIRKVKDAVREGRSLNEPLEQSGFFEPMVVQMVSIGEEIGELSQMFKKINAYYQEYVEVFLTRFTAMFEPIMLIFMGLVIGIMVIGMFLPIFEIAKIR